MTKQTLEDFMADLNTSVLNQKRIAQAMGRFLQTAKARKFIDAAASMSGDTVSSACYTSGDLLFVNVSVRELEGMKDERLAGILSAFEFMNPDGQKVEDWPQQYNRDFKFRWYHKDDSRDLQLTILVTVAAYIKNTSETCRRVLVGYKPNQEPTPIYKLECDEPENAPAREEG